MRRRWLLRLLHLLVRILQCLKRVEMTLLKLNSFVLFACLFSFLFLGTLPILGLLNNLLLGALPVLGLLNNLQLLYIITFTSGNAIPSHFTIPKNYFINYIIPFYNTSNISTFILPYYTLK